MSPLYSGPMHAYRCAICSGVVWLRPGVPPPGMRCGMMGCSGSLRRAPAADLAAAPGPSAQAPEAGVADAGASGG